MSAKEIYLLHSGVRAGEAGTRHEEHEAGDDRPEELPHYHGRGRPEGGGESGERQAGGVLLAGHGGVAGGDDAGAGGETTQQTPALPAAAGETRPLLAAALQG